jgi:glycerol kinase
MPNILAIDQGTTGTTTVLVDSGGRIVRRAYREFRQIYPRPGWVEHDPDDIWRTVEETVEELARGGKLDVAAVGITNQRETTILWNRSTGRPVHNAIVWQCRRTAGDCERLGDHAELFKERTGLPLDAYFSGTKIKWLIDNVPDARGKDVAFGTVDAWLTWKLTGGKIHATDHTNASRTLLYNIHELAWDTDLCRILGVPPAILPEVKRSADDYGQVETIPSLRGVPIRGVAGDQQAALFGQACFESGDIKNTYGTGCFLMMNTGSKGVSSGNGLLTTLAADGEGGPCYALEGAVFIAGAAIQWLRDELEIIEHAADTEAAARSAGDNGGVYFVPAFVGLGAPHWDMNARGTIVGLTRGTNRNHMIRAALESMAYQSYDVLHAMEKDTGVKTSRIAVDGGAAANDFLMQFQADVLGKGVRRPSQIESTALGAAGLAGLGSGLWSNAQELAALRDWDREFVPAMSAEERDALLAGWHKALRQAMAV